MLQNIAANQKRHLFTKTFHGKGSYENPMTDYLLELLSKEKRNSIKQKNKEKFCFFQRKRELDKVIFIFTDG